MRAIHVFRGFRLSLIVGILCSTAMVATAQDDPDAQAKIDNAMSAAPVAIAQDATILDWAVDADGNFVVLREGTNGWSCFPNIEKNTPICFDAAALQWLSARRAKEEPNLTVPGFTYQFQGGAALSNSDPFATEQSDDSWVSSDPWMMVFFPAGVDLSSFPTDPQTTGIFVMYAGTPYQHLMVPVGVSDLDE